MSFPFWDAAAIEIRQISFRRRTYFSIFLVWLADGWIAASITRRNKHLISGDISILPSPHSRKFFYPVQFVYPMCA
jgi:hypothetical protein